MKAKLIGLILGLIAASEALASDAYVKADEEFGQGVFRARGAECYFITAGHVVKEAAEIELIASNRQHFMANVVTSYPDDVAILRVNLPKGEPCQKGGWGTGAKLRALLSVEQDGVVKTRLSDGSTLQTPVYIKNYDDIRYIQVKPKDANAQFAKGFSGSTLFIDGEPAGMLQSVTNGVGKVFRQDALNNTVALFFQTVKRKSALPVDNGETKEDTKNKPASQVSASPIVFTGKVAKDQVITQSFNAHENSPLIISGSASGKSMRYKLQVLDKRNKVLLSHYDVRGRAFDLPFTPPKDGNYTLKLTGVRYYGDYSLTIGKP